MFHNLIVIKKLIRPTHWVKNGFIFLPIIFAGEIFSYKYLVQSISGFISMSFVASSVYIINDIIDIKYDRAHPEKCNKPIASGEISITLSAIIAFILLALSFSIIHFLNIPIISLVTFYFILNILYSLKLKDIPIVDVFMIATGFLIRLFVGIFISSLDPSNWMILTFFFLALFLGFGKRRAEVSEYGEKSSMFREVNVKYSLHFLDQVITLLGATVIICYALYTTVGDGARFGRGIIFTSIFVIFGIFHYLRLLSDKHIAKSPTNLLLSDKIMMIDVFLWIISCIFVIYFGGGTIR